MQPGTNDPGHDRGRTTFYRSGLLDLRSGAWRDFDRQARPRLIRFGLLRGLKPAEAEELAQRTICDFLDAVDQQRFTRARGGVRAFLYRIARCRIVDHRRATASDRHSFLEAERLDPPASGEPPQHALRIQEDLDRCIAALEATSSPRDLRIFNLRYRHDCTIRTIAELVGCSRNEVSQRLCRIRHTMRTLLQEAESRHE
ncbi:MAG: sigma-70 family RNA polymerase sigma factor [Phycisphaerales bacterium]|nr:sigma-70 family RNA polymerase sigma factor [Phycisphaerales bacterium]